ncbi:hypothetical protein ACHQM5_023193 [Ranunculus cassubicifolius]
MVAHAVVWSIWQSRNETRFEEEAFDARRIIQRIKKLLWEWGLLVKSLEGIRIEELMFNWNTLMYL